MPLQQANSDEEIVALLTRPAHWAIVGLSNNVDRVAYRVAQRIGDLGMTITPVHPRAETVHGRTGFATLPEVPAAIDVVDLFVASHRVSDLVDAAITVGAKAVWMQRGVIDHEAAARARAAGLVVVVDTCPAIEAERLLPAS